MIYSSSHYLIITFFFIGLAIGSAQERPFDIDSEIYAAATLYDDIALLNIKTTKLELRSNHTHKLDSLVCYFTSEVENVYEPDLKLEFNYDSLNTDLIFLSRKYETDDVWSPLAYTYFSHNIDDQPLIRNIYTWDGDYQNVTDTTNLRSRNTWTYNDNGQFVEFTSQNLEDIEAGMIGSRFVIFYNNKNLLEKVDQYFRRDGDDTLYYAKTFIFRHDEKDRLISESSRHWNWPDREITLDSISYSYYDNDLLKEKTDLGWTPAIGWYIYEKSEINYNDNLQPESNLISGYDFDGTIGNMDEDIYRYYPSGDLDYLSTIDLNLYTMPELKRWTQRYDFDIKEKDILRPISQEPIHPADHMLMRIENYDVRLDWTSYDEEIINRTKLVYFYSKIDDVSNSEPASELELVISPNPSSGDLAISGIENKKILQLSIYDSEGRLILTDYSDNRQIVITTLPAGVYVLHLEMEDGNHVTKRFVKMD